MFYFFVLLYSASTVYSLNFTVDGVIKFGPKLTYKYNVAVPSDPEEEGTRNEGALRHGGERQREAAGSKDIDATEGPSDPHDASEGPPDPHDASEGRSDPREASEEIETTTDNVTAEKIYSTAEDSSGHESLERNQGFDGLRLRGSKNYHKGSNNREVKSEKYDSEIYDSQDSDSHRFTKPILMEHQKPDTYNKHKKKRKGDTTEKRHIEIAKKHGKNKHNKEDEDYEYNKYHKHKYPKRNITNIIIGNWNEIPDNQKNVVHIKNRTHDMISVIIGPNHDKNKKLLKVATSGPFHPFFNGKETLNFVPQYVRQQNETGFVIDNWDNIPIDQKRVETFNNWTHSMVKVVIDDTENPEINPKFPTFVTPQGDVKTFQNQTHRIISVVNKAGDSNNATSAKKPGFPSLLPLIIPGGGQYIKNKTQNMMQGVVDKSKNKFKNKTHSMISGVVDKSKYKLKNKTHNIISSALGKIKTTKRPTTTKRPPKKKPHQRHKKNVHRNKKNSNNMNWAEFISNPFQMWTAKSNEDAVNEDESLDWVNKLKNKTFQGFLGDIKEEIVNKTNEIIQPQIQAVLNQTNQLVEQIENDVNKFEVIKNESQTGLETLYNDLNKVPLRIRDNETIFSFTKRILNRTLNLFKNMEFRSTEYRWKKKMKHLAKSYEDKFNEFLRATKHHTIRTRLGARKVILNAIDVSNRIVKRLLDFMSDDMEKRGLAYNNLTPLMFRTEISKEEYWELNRACDQLGICRSPKALPDFIVDIMLTMLSIPNNRFKSAFGSLIEAAKNTDFSFSEKLNNGIRRKLDYYNRQDVHVQKGMLMIVKNIIANRNTPLVLYKDTDPTKSRLHSTLAFLDIINTLDEKVPTYEDDFIAWNDMSRQMKDYIDGKNDDIQNILNKCMVRFANAIKDVDYATWQLIIRNANILFS